MKILLQTMQNVKREAIVCSDANSPTFSMGVEQVKKGYIAFGNEAEGLVKGFLWLLPSI